MDNFEYLDDKLWSPLWEHYLAKASLFDSSAIHEIICILSLPERSGVLVFTEDEVFFSDSSALKTLHRFSTFHSFSDYHVLAHSLKKLGHFGTYKMPWVCPFFTLFPLESKDHTIWINPLTISRVFKHHGQHYVQMINDLILILPVHRRRFVTHAETACLVLATIRRGVFHYVIHGECPLDYLFFPNTPFARTLSKKERLKKFRTAIGEINRLYQITYSLYHCSPLMDDTQEFGDIQWL